MCLRCNRRKCKRLNDKPRYGIKYLTEAFSVWCQDCILGLPSRLRKLNRVALFDRPCYRDADWQGFLAAIEGELGR